MSDLKEQTFSANKIQFSTEIEIDIQPKRRVGILGGTFNPPHIGHLIIADQVCHQLGLEKIYFMPSANPPHQDEKKAIDAKHRLHMVELAIEDNMVFDVEKSEIDRGGKSYTYDTLVKLKEEHPDIEYYFIIGGDMVEYLPKWYKIEDLAQLVEFVGVNRPGYPFISPYSIIWVDVPSMDISSTSLRKNLKMNCPVNYLIPEKTLNYIRQEGLYQDGK
ncbi:nicotinate-nucleotide adenylyltransferase [Carnobacterium alterfunditum]|uniref:nicotinate-nucleotide adenylyltransferase n=1 Tax=Carnobacterium alterfunditum TaxID=28230 RepID=UPI0015BEB499|nr:nicotinate-nucleotide adenylyltransferase [Carnobacterium alterfunditum]